MKEKSTHQAQSSVAELGYYDRVASGEADVNVFAELLTLSSSNVRALGYESGPVPYPIVEAGRQVDAGIVHLVDTAEQPSLSIATYSVQYEDPRMWGEQSLDAIYVHSLAVRPEYWGRNIGDAVLQDIGRLALAKGLEAVRLDVPVSNLKLRGWYENRTFKHVGNKTILAKTAGQRDYYAALYSARAEELIAQSIRLSSQRPV